MVHTGPTSWGGDLCSCSGFCAHTSFTLDLILCCYRLKILKVFEREFYRFLMLLSLDVMSSAPDPWA